MSVLKKNMVQNKKRVVYNKIGSIIPVTSPEVENNVKFFQTFEGKSLVFGYLS